MYLLDTNVLIILMFGNIANGNLSDETLQLMEKEKKLSCFQCLNSILILLKEF